jgi:hypothetical protein
MEKIHGDMIGRGWLSQTAESKTKIHSQLQGMIAEMRKLTPTTPRVSYIDGGKLYDCRIHEQMQFGPFESTQDFHRYLRGVLEPNVGNPEDVNELIAWQDGPWPSPVFTHGD